MRAHKIATTRYQVYPSGDVFNLFDKWVFKIEDPRLLDFIEMQTWRNSIQKARLDAMLDDREEGIRNAMNAVSVASGTGGTTAEIAEEMEHEMPPRFPMNKLRQEIKTEILPGVEDSPMPRPCDHFLYCRECLKYHAHAL